MYNLPCTASLANIYHDNFVTPILRFVFLLFLMYTIQKSQNVL